MIRITEPKDCCGCGACLQSCPRQCITFHTDSEGFEYPQVAEDRCVDCGLCERVCPMLNAHEERMPQDVLGAVATDESLLRESSSGALFRLLATAVINQGGVVVAARFDDNQCLVHQCTDNMADLPAFCGSKYVQSSNHEAFLQVRRHLKDGRRVLFCGTPCQVAALRNLPYGNDDHLLAIDFICHGVPSPGVWSACLRHLMDKHHFQSSDIVSVRFRDKTNGWRKYQLAISLKNGHVIRIKRKDNVYQQAFDESLTLRPSCYSCRARRGRSHSDITLGDFWDINYLQPELDHDTGFSLVLCNTRKGFDSLPWKDIRSFETPLQSALAHNPAFLSTSTLCHPRRAEFFKSWQQGHNNTAELLKQSLHQPLPVRIKRQIDEWKYSIKLLVLPYLKKLKK